MNAGIDRALSMKLDPISVSPMDHEKMMMNITRKNQKLHFPFCGTETASFGVAQALIGEEVDPLILRADVALYVSKKLGKNRVNCSDNSTEQKGE